VTDQDRRGFIKVVYRPHGEVLGAQIVAARAGEIVHELALAIDRHIKLPGLASSMHVYPTYSVGVQQLAADVRLESLAASPIVKRARGLASLGGS
jgi:pyruvate/2-oxoglutarate dehydrogenase complex dihydrolipoamide dehydrogenase (E3) component